MKNCALAGLRYFVGMSKVNKLLHTRYRVNDLERTIRFYRDVLGLQELKRHKSPRGSELVFLKALKSDEEIEICSFPAAGKLQISISSSLLGAFRKTSSEPRGDLCRLISSRPSTSR